MGKSFFAGLLLALAAPFGAALAQSGAIDARTFDQLSKAQTLASEERHEDALRILDRLKARGGLNSYASAQLWNVYAFIHANREQYNEAIAAYDRVLAEPEAPEGLILTAKYTTAQLYFQMERYDDCIRYMKEWLNSTDTPTATAHIMLAQAYYQKSDHATALGHVNNAIGIEQFSGKTVQESWLRLKAALQFTLNDYPGTAQTYETLLALYPRISYLRQLAGVYSELEQPSRRLALFDAVYEYGALDKEADLLNLVYMWLGESVPFKAGRVLETALDAGRVEASQKNIETLANAWAQANEYDKAIPALRRAADMADDGIFHARLAGVHFNAGDYEAAARAAAEADRRGGLKNAAGNLVLLGMAHFNARDYENALQAFRRAKQDRASFTAADKWESYTLAEVERLRAMARGRQELERRTRDALDASENNIEALSISGSP